MGCRDGSGYVLFLRFLLIVFFVLGVQIGKGEGTTVAAFSASDTSSFIYTGENAVIVGKEYLFVKQDSFQDLQAGSVEKQIHKVKRKNTSPAVENSISEEKPENSCLFALPPVPASLSFSICEGSSAIIVPQHRLNGTQAEGKINREKGYLNIGKSDLSLYFPDLRQKFSPAATQCGMLVSFGPNSPGES